MELKSTENGSFTYWRKDFENDGKKHSYQIKKNQILGLTTWNRYAMNCGFVLNFRSKENRTFFVMINEFLDYTNQLAKKSINMNDVLQMNPIEIKSEIKRTHYRYDIVEFLSNIKL